MPEAPVPEGGAPMPEQGGGAAEAVAKVGEVLQKLAESATSNPEVPDEAKTAIQASLEAFQAFADALSGGGGSSGPQPQPEQGVTTPEQGASGAQPMSMGRPR